MTVSYAWHVERPSALNVRIHCQGDRPGAGDTRRSIAATVYDRLFQNEHIKALYNQSNRSGGGRQTQAPASALVVYFRISTISKRRPFAYL